MLVLFTLMFTVVILCIMIVVDVGFFLHERQTVQATADAAALAGAQELPDNPDEARVQALNYVELNGLDPDEVTITFRCTSDSQPICLDGDGRYDTIVVTPKGQAPNFFGGILRIVGVDNCWVDGCHVTATAAGCRGACGPIGTGPADIMVVMDHSASMSVSNITNSKNAITQMFTDFNNQYQQVGVAVTPPVTTSNNCDSIDHWAETKVWMPAALTFGFQSSPHILNPTSPAVSVPNCIDRTDFSYPNELTDYPVCSCHTDVGTAIGAASDELIANGRPDVTHGMIIVTDGASNVAPLTTTTTTTTTPSDTGFNYCTTSSAVSSSAGDNNGYESSGSSGCTSNNSYAQDVNSGTTTTTTCPDTSSSGGSGASGKDKHRYYNFSLSSEVPSGATLTGIEVRLDGMTTVTTGIRKFCVQLSWDGGSSWTTAQEQSITSTSERSYYFGGSNDLWGRTWTTTQLNNTNFRVRITDVADSTSRTFRLDATAVKVHYTEDIVTSTTTFDNNLGPCDYTKTKGDAAKAAGIEIFVIGFGVPTDEKCSDYGELSTSPYYNTYAKDFLKGLATDDDHYYNQPKTSDLAPIFQSIGSQLTAGSRLVE